MQEQEITQLVDAISSIVPGATLHLFENKDSWRAFHKLGLSGTDAGIILNVNKRKNDRDLYLEKKGLNDLEQAEKEQIALDNNPRVLYGKNAEGHLRKLFMLDYENKFLVIEQPEEPYFWCFRNKQNNFLICTPDGIILERDTNRLGVLEIKTTVIDSEQAKEQWNGKIPQNYYCQLVHNMNVLGAEFGILHVQLKYVHGDNVTCVRKSYFYTNEECKALEKVEVNWWNRYFVRNEEPSVKLIF